MPLEISNFGMFTECKEQWHHTCTEEEEWANFPW